MNRNIVFTIAVFITTVVVGIYVYSKKESYQKAQINSFDFVPSGFSEQIIQINNPVKNLEELFFSNLLWKELKNDELSIIETFWKQKDSVFSELKSNSTSLTILSGKSSSTASCFILELRDMSEDSITLNGWKTKATKNFVCFTKKEEWLNLSTFNDQVESINNNESFDSLNSLFDAESDGIYIFNKLDNNWSVEELIVYPEQLFTTGFSPNRNNFRILNSNLDVSVVAQLPIDFNQIELLHFDTISDLSFDSAYDIKKAKECNCEASFLAKNWINSPLVKYESQFGGASYLVFNINGINDFKQGMNDLLPDSLKKEGQENLLIRKFNGKYDYNSFFKSKLELNYFVRINDFVVFAEKSNELERFVFQYNSDFTIANNRELFSFVKSTVDENSEYVNLSSYGNFLGTKIKDGISISQTHSQIANFTYNSTLFTKKIKLDGSRVNPKWSIDFAENIYPTIYKFKNHRTQDNDFLVQDENKMLHYITPNGETKWKKQLDGRIVGQIKNIDFLGNAKNQIVCNTESSLYIIDILGRNVDNFPVKIESPATFNVSILDYDNNQNFRFLIPSKDGILSYNKTGKPVKGWAKPKTEAEIDGDIQHLLISGLDYVFAHDAAGNAYFYNRKGEVRHSIEGKFSYPLKIVKGSNIGSSRALYLDTISNSLAKRFFSNKEANSLLPTDKTIKQISYIENENNRKSNIALVFEDELRIYSSDLNLIETKKITGTFSSLKIWKDGYGFINNAGDLIINYQGKTKIVENVDDFFVDSFKNQLRIIISGNKSVKLLLI